MLFYDVLNTEEEPLENMTNIKRDMKKEKNKQILDETWENFREISKMLKN